MIFNRSSWGGNFDLYKLRTKNNLDIFSNISKIFEEVTWKVKGSFVVSCNLVSLGLSPTFLPNTF